MVLFVFSDYYLFMEQMACLMLTPPNIVSNWCE